MIQVRHTIIRVLGTCLVGACFDEKQQHVSDSEASPRTQNAAVSADVFSLLRKTHLLRARIRRSIAYAFVYTIASGLCSSLASSVSELYIWTTFSEVATAVLLERIHYRWTNSIVGRSTKTMRGYSSRELLLPTIMYALARKLVAEGPAAIATLFVVESTTSTDAVAARDIAVLASAFALRFFVLYPAWASLICHETRRTSRLTDNLGDQSHSYIGVLRRCYQELLLRISALHLQAAGIMIGIETVTYIVSHFLLHTPINTISV